MKRYIIIGNGVAAAGCIEGIRSRDREGSITVISEEMLPAYCRPLISYYLEDKTSLDRMNYRSDDFYDKTGCEVLYGRKAVKINAEAKQVQLDDEKQLTYDALCIAAGSSPFVPLIEGLEQVDQKFTFITLDDTLALERAVTPDASVLIIGAGLIGLKCAEGLHQRAKSITVCDLSDRVLSSILDTECAAVMQKHLESAGVHFLLSDTAVRFEKNTAFMKSCKTVNFDILVLTLGVRPNTALVKEAGGDVNRGILLNEKSETSLPCIYAAGDCTEDEDSSIGGKRMLAILPNAYMQGYTAGVNMSGGDASFADAIPMNSIGFFGLHAMTAGSYDGEMFEEKTEDSLKRFFIRDGRLAGFILIGGTERAEIYTSLIRSRTKLEEIRFDLLTKTATTAAFSHETRRKNFGGVV